MRKNNIREEVLFLGRSNKAVHQVTAAQLGRKFSLASSRSLPQTSLAGCYKLVNSEGYEDFLRAVGCGPLSLNMVMRSASFIEIGRVSVNKESNVLIMKWLSIIQTLDEHWKISCETAIKARSVSGYSTCNRKMILNKFFEGEPKVNGNVRIFQQFELV